MALEKVVTEDGTVVFLNPALIRRVEVTPEPDSFSFVIGIFFSETDFVGYAVPSKAEAVSEVYRWDRLVDGAPSVEPEPSTLEA